MFHSFIKPLSLHLLALNNQFCFTSFRPSVDGNLSTTLIQHLSEESQRILVASCSRCISLDSRRHQNRNQTIDEGLNVFVNELNAGTVPRIAVRRTGCDVGLKGALRFARLHILGEMGVHEAEINFYIGNEKALIERFMSFFNRVVPHSNAGNQHALNDHGYQMQLTALAIMFLDLNRGKRSQKSNLTISTFEGTTKKSLAQLRGNQLYPAFREYLTALVKSNIAEFDLELRFCRLASLQYFLNAI